MSVGYGLDQEMFKNQRVKFLKFDGNKNGSPKEHKFRVLPAYAPGKLFHVVGLHWGFREAGGQQRALVCSLSEHGSCPVCDKVVELKGHLENIEAGLKTQFAPEERAQLESQKQEIGDYVSLHKKKPMFVWNILSGEDEQGVLQLSRNPHEALFEKIKFIFTNYKKDITDVTKSTLMYCSRSGLKVSTRYQFDMLPDFEKDLTGKVVSLTDLSKVYIGRSVEYLQSVVETGIVPPEGAAPQSQMSHQSTTHEPPQNAQLPLVGASAVVPNVASPTPTTAAVAPSTVVPTPVAAMPQVTVPTASLTPDQDKNVADMMAALNS